MNEKWTKDDTKMMILFIAFVLIFMLLIIGPKPYWLDGGGVILK